MPFRKEKKIPFYMQNLNKIFSLSLHLPRVWRPLPAVERLHNHFPTQKTVTTSRGSWHHSKPSSLLNVTEWVSQSVSRTQTRQCLWIKMLSCVRCREKKIIENRYNPRKKRQAVSAVSRRRSNFVAKEVHSALNEAEDAPISQETSLWLLLD